MTSTVIAAQGLDNNLMFYWQTFGTHTWNAEQVAGPQTTFSLPSVAQVGDSVVIAAVGPDNSLITGRPSARRPGTNNRLPCLIPPLATRRSPKSETRR